MARLGVEAGSLHVDRVRLLDLLPDTVPHVVVLEAPTGFGKTDLALSWVARLAAEGWRSLVVSQRGRDLRTAIAAALEMPSELDWGLLERELWRRPTLLVIDDLEQAARADPASDPATVPATVLADTGGWPLLVAYAASTGAPLVDGAVATALRSGLSEPAWRRLMLQAAVPDAPRDLGGDSWSEAFSQLERAGFVTVEEAGSRLTPTVVRALLRSRVAEVRQVVAEVAPWLSERQACAAHEATLDATALAATLETATSALERDDPHALLRWHGLATATAGGSRRIRVGNALCAVGRRGEGIELLVATAADETLTADLRLTALGDAIYFLAEQPDDRGTARRLLHEADSLLASASPERQGRFLSTASAIDFRAGDYQAAKRLVERALQVLPPSNRHRYAPLMNLAVLDWNLSGDIEGRIRLQHEGLEICRAEYPDHVVGVCRDLAQLCLYLGREAEARAYLAEATRFEAARPVLALEVEAMSAQLDDDLDALTDVARRAASLSDPGVVDAIAARHVAVLTRHGQARKALSLAAGLSPPGGFTAVALALAHLALGERAEAERRLSEVEDPAAEREYRLAWLAAKYRVGGSVADLEALCRMTSAGEAVLPFFVPLAELPRDRHDLAAHYPLAEVMRSGWKAATAARLAEVPPLDVTTLGAVCAEVLGESLELIGRQRDLMALLVLGLGRRELGAALWPDAEPERVRNNLNVQFNLLRRLIEPWGVRTYLFEDGMRHTDSDLRRLREALAAGRAEEVMALYRGPFAPGVEVEAVADARTALERSVAESLVEAAAAAPRQRAAAYLKRALELEPLNEEAVQSLLGLLVTAGRHGEALRRYRNFASDLAAQLGMAPLAATTRLVLPDPSR